MSMVICGECRQRISDQAARCPYCGVNLRNNIVNWIGGIFLVAVIFFITWYALNTYFEERKRKQIERIEVGPYTIEVEKR